MALSNEKIMYLTKKIVSRIIKAKFNLTSDETISRQIRNFFYSYNEFYKETRVNIAKNIKHKTPNIREGTPEWYKLLWNEYEIAFKKNFSSFIDKRME